MPRDGNVKSRKSALHRAAEAVKRLFMRGGAPGLSPAEETQRAEARRSKPTAKAAKPVHREADIPLELLDRTYTPPMTSSKASFRSDGSDHQLDQEFAFGRADNDQWKDEDRYTNKSGDPRIGTHRRTDEPEESRTGQE